MKVETKFNIGELIWVMADNKVHRESIQTITITVDTYSSETSAVIDYTLNSQKQATNGIKFRESNVFRTKEDLLKSL